LRELLIFSKFHIINHGETVYRQGEFSTSLYVIFEGAVDVCVNLQPDDLGAAGQKVSAQQATEFFGEINLISARVRSGTVKATRASLLWEIDRKAMLKFMQTNSMARQIIDKIFLINSFRTHLFPNV